MRVSAVRIFPTRAPLRFSGLLPRGRPSLRPWAYYRGDRKLLAALVGLNLANLPLMFGGEGGAAPMAQNRFILPNVILVTIVLAWAVMGRFGRTSRPNDHAMMSARPRAEAPAG